MSYTETMLEYVFDEYCRYYNIKDALDFLEGEVTEFTREEIKDMIHQTVDYKKEEFIKYYKSLVEGFKSKFNFTEIICEKERVNWPNKSGVYVIWKNDLNSIDSLIYVGMTGKFKRVSKEKVVFNSGTFDKRKGRWTPYRFCESPKDEEKCRFEFRYDPKESSVKKQSKIKYEINAYKERVSYTDLQIHCFHISDNHRDNYTPELLEKEILTKFYKASGNLPPANNEL